MSVDPAAIALGAVGCGAAGLLVPALIRRIREPEPDPDAGPEQGKTPYAAVAAERTLPAVAVGWSAVAGALVGLGVGLSWPLLYLLPLVPVGVALAVVDLRTRLLPTVVVWPTLGGVAALGCVSAWLEGDADALVRAGIAAAGVFAFFYALWWIHPPGMGFGDVRLSAVLGFALGYLGWAEVVVGVYAAFLAFAVPGLLVAVLRRDRGVLRASYPFGPFLLGGALVGVVLGDPLWSGLVAG
ncbi:MAG TPA: A24 family peptidase [Nocardioides sp.]|nr:A24 family peptidase [Nocardioides sp.]